MYRLINKAVERLSYTGPFLIHTPWVKNIGNCAEEIFFGLLKAKREGKKVLFLFHQHELPWKFRLPVANRELFHVESEYAVLNDNFWGRLGGWLLTLVYSPMRVTYLVWHSTKLRAIRLRQLWTKVPLAVPVAHTNYKMPVLGRRALWQPQGVDSFSWEVVDSCKWKQQYDEYQAPRLSKTKREYAEQLRVQMGIPLSDWFACFHVREGGFHSDDPGAIRNASIQNYCEGIRVITDAGGWVVRLGDPSMTPLPPMERVLDYPHTRFKSELMDVYLISQCRIFVGTNSGPYDAALLFRRPVILVNLTEWATGFPMREGDLAITKHIFARSRNRFLSLREVLEEPFGCQELGPLSDEYMLFENRPDEIRDVIAEFLSKSRDDELSPLQEAFRHGRKRQIRGYLDQGWPFFPAACEEDRVVEKYRFASRIDSAAGSLGQKYLEQNWVEDRMNADSAR